MLSRKGKYIYFLLFKLFLALTPSLIHPDETFQSFESFVHILVPTWNLSANIPWEFNCDSPVRSLVSPALLLGPPFVLLRSVGSALGLLQYPSTFFLFILCHLYIAIVTIFVEQMFLSNVESFLGSEMASITSTLLTFSWPIGVLMSRPLSNTIESWAVALLLISALNVDRYISERKTIRAAKELLWFAFILCIGTFSRFTFIFFTSPVCIWLLFSFIREYRVTHSFKVIGPVLLFGMISFISSILFIVNVDTVYYGGKFLNTLNISWWKSAKFTPVNAFLYNSQASNLAIHGTHPHWLHFIVNMTLLFGPLWLLVVGFVVYIASSFILLPFLHFTKAQDISVSPFILLCASIVTSGLFFLSLAPHQEPRFLLPLSFPLAICGAFILTKKVSNQLLQTFYSRYITYPCRFKITFFALYILFNLTCILFFGFIHQGGIKPMTSIISFGISTSHLSSSSLSLPSSSSLSSFLSSSSSSSFSAFIEKNAWSGLFSISTLNKTLLYEAVVKKKTRSIIFFSTYPSSQALLFQQIEHTKQLPATFGSNSLFLHAPWCIENKTSSTLRPQIQSINVGSSKVSALENVLLNQFEMGPANSIIVSQSHLSEKVHQAALLSCTRLGYDSATVDETLASVWPHLSMEDIPPLLFSYQSLKLEAHFVECINYKL